MRKGRAAVDRGGAANWCAKLTEVEALSIYWAEGSQQSIADQYGITQAIVSLIKAKKLWKHIHETT